MRTLLLVGLLAGFAGCSDDDDDGSALGPAPPSGRVLLIEDFSNGFPGPDWRVSEGFPFADEERGNSPPGLVLGLFARSRAHSSFEFTTAEPVTVAFDLATPGVLTESNARFRFAIKREVFPAGEAAFEVRLKDGIIRFEILGAAQEFDFFTDQAFRRITFSVERGVATWRVDGQPFMNMAGFPEDLYFLEIESTPGGTLGFVVDNVIVTTP